MIRPALVLFVVVGSLATFPRVSTADMDRQYALQKASTYEDGCFAPCMCPVLVHDDLRGRFNLNLVGTENGYDVFEVKNVQWFVTLWDGSTIVIRGSGTYRASNATKLQRMELDLEVSDRPVEHYDSGLVPIQIAPPDINITISKNGQFCRDTVFTLYAAPAPNDLRPPKLQFEDRDADKGAASTWGRLKRLWAS